MLQEKFIQEIALIVRDQMQKIDRLEFREELGKHVQLASSKPVEKNEAKVTKEKKRKLRLGHETPAINSNAGKHRNQEGPQRQGFH